MSGMALPTVIVCDWPGRWESETGWLKGEQITDPLQHWDMYCSYGSKVRGGTYLTQLHVACMNIRGCCIL